MTRSALPLLTAALAGLSAPALAEVPRVITDIPPVHALASAVMAGVGTPELLLDRGASPHHATLRPSQAAALEQADALFWVGPALTPWLDRAVDSLPKADTAIRLDQVAGLHTQEFGASGAHDHDHAAEGDHDHAAEMAADHDHAAETAPSADHDHGPEAPATAEAEHDHEGEDGHSHTGTDPHLWLDPVNATLWLGAIRDRLSVLDPEHAAQYSENAKKAEADLAALDAQIAETLAPVRGKPFAVFHDAYGYFTAHYGLEPAHPVAFGDAALPGAERLSALRAEMTAGGLVCAFPEAQHDPKLVQQLIDGTPVKLGGALDPSGSSLEPGAGLYATLLGGMAQTLVECLADKG